MMADGLMKPDTQVIRQHLDMITARWAELDEPPELEIRAINKEIGSTHVGRFKPTEIADAAQWCADMNTTRNIYAIVNPIRPTAPRKGATDADVIASCWCWIDCDEAPAADRAKNFVGPKHSFAIITGTIPHTRPHVYWELAEWQHDLAAWRNLQERLAAHFGSDPTVVNYSRIMRVAGTVTFPDQGKRARGYASEVAMLRPRANVVPTRFPILSGLFPPKAAPAPASGIQIDTGSRAALPLGLDRDAAYSAALRGEEWHNNMVRVVASLVAKGLQDGEIHAITDRLTLTGYTVDQTRRDVQQAIDGARRKGWDQGSEAATDWQTPEARATVEAAPFRPWREIDLRAIRQPEFIYSDFYARRYTSVTFAPPKVGKSMLGLAEAIDMATGRGFLTGVRRDPLKVVYFNAEDDQDVIDNRVAALLSLYGITQAELAGRLFATSGVDWEGFYLVSGNEPAINEKAFIAIEQFLDIEQPDALIFDPLQDLSHSPETNDTFRLLGQRLRRLAVSRGVALGLIHHTRKMAPGVAPSMDDGRGGSSLRGTARFNRILAPMTEAEAIKAGVANHRHFFRIADAESNLAPPSAEVNCWFEKINVETPSGAHVGAVKRWEWPDAFEGVTPKDAARVRAEIDRMAEPPRADVRSKAWAGEVVASVLGWDTSDAAVKARVKSILGVWISTDVLRVTEARDARAGRDVQVIVCGANDPKNDGD